ncbi:MAG: bifunctional adenosylcobinamide kinase/adenosylcobinamide-phosphate guanylyltransferase [Clostridium sp.]|uniref:bifunctional adenosylcobinamide kinase/adenosylcobinamide-phosphate guanylyltransferase n=1 Tax=Clostridium sp. TaxID=1506 RepID=UPI0025BD3925|nr:bifunctional adenosylcobinamide kinase/adenosylcobinamide-phosphate guanylyltransferase [Clostridium sp.]MCE5221207.1 bifunctional adenosylcobinamide kinase/adenosylcobinamide-phosphate guanylyltransferase [Clostridium sp.]
MNYLIIGGSKSGKSEASEKIALTLNKDKVIYIATMKPYDKEDEERIKKHIQNRVGLNFITLEVQRNLHEIVNNIKYNDTVLIDSITSLLTNEMFIENKIIENPSVNIVNGLKKIMIKAKNTVIVSDYIFNDAIKYDEVTETFKKELAIINKELSKISDNVMECSFGNIRYIKL